MAKSASKLLKDLLAFCTSENHPNPGSIVADLNKIIPLVESLEMDMNLPEFQKEYDKLKSEFDARNADFETQKSHLVEQINSLENQIEALRAEKTDNTEADNYLTDVQFEIINVLAPEGYGDGLTIKKVRVRLDFIFDRTIGDKEFAIEFEALKRRQYIVGHFIYDGEECLSGEDFWYATIAGACACEARRENEKNE